MEEINNNNMQEKNSNCVLYVIIIILCLLILGLGGFIIYDKSLDNKKTDIKETNNTVTDNTVTETQPLTGKIDINDYCPGNGNCKKDIGDIIINDKTLKLSVNINNINTENVSGTISLGTSEIDILELERYDLEKKIDGFEVYNDYLILYTSSLEIGEIGDCMIRGYSLYFLDYNLNYKGGLAGYTKDNPLEDFKVENDEIYYYALNTDIGALTYNKINISHLLNSDFSYEELIANIMECHIADE